MKFHSTLDIHERKMISTLTIDLDGEDSQSIEVGGEVTQAEENLASIGSLDVLEGMEKYIIGRLDELESKIKRGELVEAKYAEWIEEKDVYDSPTAPEGGVEFYNSTCSYCGNRELLKAVEAGSHCRRCGAIMRNGGSYGGRADEEVD